MKSNTLMSNADIARELGIPDDLVGDHSHASTAPANNPIALITVAALLSVALWFVPFAHFAVYPFRMLSTFIHELSHALAALVTGGSVQGISLDWRASGLTLTAGGWYVLIASAGYLGTTAAGAFLLRMTSREVFAKPLLAALGLLLLVTAVVFGGNFVAWVTGALLGVVLIGASALLSQRTARFALSFLSIQILLNSVFDLDALLTSSVRGAGHSDAANLAQLSHGWLAAPVWALGWSALSALMLLMTTRSLLRSAPNRS